jgi:hypothetical protein
MGSQLAIAWLPGCTASWHDKTNREDHGLSETSSPAGTKAYKSGIAVAASGLTRLVSHKRSIAIDISAAPSPSSVAQRPRSSAVLSQ